MSSYERHSVRHCSDMAGYFRADPVGDDHLIYEYFERVRRREPPGASQTRAPSGKLPTWLLKRQSPTAGLACRTRLERQPRPESIREGQPVSDRILRLRRRLLKETPVVSIERAKYYTEHWRSTEESGLAPGIRVALAMKHVYEQMRHQVDPDDRIAGAWTENAIGIPLDIERGLFNRVFAIECDRPLDALVPGEGEPQVLRLHAPSRGAAGALPTA